MNGDPFRALADATRRGLLDQLRARDGQTLNELCRESRMSRQAVSKHLAILEQAELVLCVMRGRHKHHFLNPVPLQEIVDRWIAPYRRHQVRALIDLKRDLESDNDSTEQ